jgi:cell division protein FtsL
MNATRRGRPAAQRAKKVVHEAASDLAPVLTAVMLAIPIVLAGLFFVWTRVVTVRLGYEISRASDDHHRLLEENRGLRIESAALKAPARLQEIAVQGRRLVPPRPEQIIRLDSIVQREASPGDVSASAPLARGVESP